MDCIHQLVGSVGSNRERDLTLLEHLVMSEQFRTDDTIALIKTNFGKWFGMMGDVPVTPMLDAFDHVITYLAQVTKIANARSKENPDGSGPLGLWSSANVQAQWETAKERYRAAVGPMFKKWTDEGRKPANWFGIPNVLSKDDAAKFWDESKRLALSINQVFGSETDASITNDIFKGTVKDTINNLKKAATSPLPGLPSLPDFGKIALAVLGIGAVVALWLKGDND